MSIAKTLLLLLLAGVALVVITLTLGPGNDGQPEKGGATDLVSPEATPPTPPGVTPQVPTPVAGEAKERGIKRQQIDPTKLAEAAGGCLFSGRVMDNLERPVAGAAVNFNRIMGFGKVVVPLEKGGQKTITDKDGRWSLRLSEPEAGKKYHVVATMSGFIPATREIEVGSSEMVMLPDLKLIPGVTVVGTIRDESGNPVVGAKINPRGPGQLMIVGRNRDDGLQTDAQGRYQLTGLKPGKAKIHVDAKDFALAFREVKLVVNAVPMQVDFVLTKGYGISGRVVSAVGLPLKGAKVQLVRERKTEGFSMITQSGEEAASTDREGYFRIGGLEKGNFRLSVNHPGYLGESRSKVAAGAQGLVFKLGQGGSVTGLVLGVGGKPAGDYTLKKHHSPTVAGLAMMGEKRTWKFGPQDKGVFLISGLRPGEHVMELLAADLPPHQVKFTVTEGDRTDCGTIKLQPGTWLEIKVTNLAGEPLAGAKVNAVKPSAGNNRMIRLDSMDTGPGNGKTGGLPFSFSTGGQGNSAVTDEKGQCFIKGLAAGDWVVKASHNDYAPTKTEPVTAATGKGTPVRVCLHPGGEVEVTVRDQQGQPLVGEKVSLALKGGGPLAAGSAKTNAEGVARLAHLAPGDYEVGLQRDSSFQVGGAAMMVSMPGMGSSKKVPVSVKEGELSRVEYVAPGTWTLSGVITDAVGPVVGATVALKAAGAALPFGGPKTKTGPDGAFSLTKVRAGKYSLTWGRTGCTVKSTKSIDLGESGGQWQRNLVIPAGMIVGKVLDGEGKPVAGLQIKVAPVVKASSSPRVKRSFSIAMIGGGRRGMQGLNLGGKGPKPVLTDEEGRYKVIEVPPGDWRIAVHRQGEEKPVARSKVKVESAGKAKVAPIKVK